MKRRLSDADDLTFWHLALHCERRDRRLSLNFVHVENGRAWATDSYRMLTAPVEAEWSGRVSVTDALAGGTVDVLPLDANFGPERMAQVLVMASKYPSDHAATLTLDADDIATLAPWCERAPKFAEYSSEWAPTTAEIGPRWLLGRDAPIRLPDGSVVRPDEWSGPTPTGLVQAPWLARAVCSVAQLGGGGVLLSGQGGPQPLVATPVDSIDVVAVLMQIMPPIGRVNMSRKKVTR